MFHESVYIGQQINNGKSYFCTLFIGSLVATGCSLAGHGGSATVDIRCSGCSVSLKYSSSSMATYELRRNVVSYALRLAAFASGIGFSGYHKLFGRHLGMSVTSDKVFIRVIEEAFSHITSMLDEVCELGKESMKALPGEQIGSWAKAVTTSDGCWQIRGFFSQNSTFVIGSLERFSGMDMCV